MAEDRKSSKRKETGLHVHKTEMGKKRSLRPLSTGIRRYHLAEADSEMQLNVVTRLAAGGGHQLRALLSLSRRQRRQQHEKRDRIKVPNMDAGNVSKRTNVGDEART